MSAEARMILQALTLLRRFVILCSMDWGDFFNFLSRLYESLFFH